MAGAHQQHIHRTFPCQLARHRANAAAVLPYSDHPGHEKVGPEFFHLLQDLMQWCSDYDFHLMTFRKLSLGEPGSQCLAAASERVCSSGFKSFQTSLGQNGDGVSVHDMQHMQAGVVKLGEAGGVIERTA